MRLRDARWHVAAVVASVGIGAVGLAAPAVAAERALELVTPSGSIPDVKIGGGASTPDGNVVCFSGESMIAGSASNGQVTADDGFCATRTASGWETRWVTGPAPRLLRGGYGSQVYFVSDDARRVVFASDAGIFPDYNGELNSPRTTTLSAHMWEDGETRWLAPTPDPSYDFDGFAPIVSRHPLAASHDLRYGIFQSALRLLPEDENTVADVYQWTPDGIRLVSRDESRRAVGGHAPVGEGWLGLPGAISEDGSRVFFERTSGPPILGEPRNVYSVFMREGDELTLVSPRLVPGTARNIRFAGASADGTVVYLTTDQQLTDTPKRNGTAIYRYDTETRSLRLVVDDDADAGVAFLAVSADGETIAYTRGPGLELHVRRGGDDWLVGNLMAGVDTVYLLDAAASTRADKRGLRLSADGRTLVFASYNNVIPSEPAAFRKQIYRWTAEEGVRRVSMAADGGFARDDAYLGNFTTAFPGRPRYLLNNAMREHPNLGRAMSDDGSRVFFEAAEALVPEDVNGKIDVYEWHDGEVRLVSPGTQPDHAFYHDNSADGRVVFFTTHSRLIPELDRNTSRDLYAAVEGGGFELSPAPVRCVDDACQPPAPAPPALQRGATRTFVGPDDEEDPAPRTVRVTVARLTRRQLRTFARRGVIVLRVRANARGVLTTTATARIRRRDVRVARTVEAARANRTVRIPLRLSRRAIKVLRTRRRLRITVRVAHDAMDTPIRRVVMLRA